MINLAVLFFGMLILTGCFNDENHDHIIEYLKEHFQTNENVIYHEPKVALSPNHTFSFELSHEIYERITTLNGHASRNIFSVFIDSDLTKRIPLHATFERETLRVVPTPLRTILEETYSRRSWDYFSHYYLVQNFDLTTGEKLEIPIVTAFTINRPLAKPVLSITHEADNSFTLSWEEVPRAEAYYLVRIDFLDRFDFVATIIDTTTGTSWNTGIEGQGMENVYAEIFANYRVSKDQQLASDAVLWWDDEEVLAIGSVFGVMAKSGEEFSNLSFFREDKIDQQTMICELAPFALAEVMATSTIESTTQIPAFLPATACDGNTINAGITLDLDYVTWRDDGLYVPYTFSGSTWRDYFIIPQASTTNYREELAARQVEMDEQFLQNERHDYRYQSTRAVAFDVRKSNTLPEVHDTIFSTSELETFIAANMIDGAAMIDISSFAAEDTGFMQIHHLLMQIRYQNPLILQFQGVYYDYQNRVIFVHFLYDPETRAEIQQTIRDEVSRVANEITTPEMSDVQKVVAINQFIIDTTEYDEAAYEAIKAATDHFLIEDYFHASTAKGVFLRGLAVCEGYAAAFMLLTDYVGIPSIMVTGHTVNDPDERHAWNRVLIEGQWYVVDPTHNDLEKTPNSVLLLADDIADYIYIADTFFLIDDLYDDFRALGPSIFEYYYSRGLFANGVLEATNLLISQLQNQNQATIRLPINSTIDEFDQVGQAIADHFHRNIIYHYFNGVMHIILQ